MASEQGPRVSAACVTIDGTQGGQREDGTSTASSTSDAAVAVLDKLAAMDMARKAERERRREESRAVADPRESVAQFLRSFGLRQRGVEDALQRMLLGQQGQGQATAQDPIQPQVSASSSGIGGQLQAGSEQGDLPPLAVSAASPEAIQASLELLSAEVLSMEQSTAGASYFLPAYDQKQCASAMATLRAAIDGARASLAPRKRFAFGSKKVNKIRGEELSAAAAAPPPSDPSTSAPAPSGPASSAVPASSSSPSDAPAPAPEHSISDQDRALIARGRGLAGLSNVTIVRCVSDLSYDDGGGGVSGASGGDFVLHGLVNCTVVLLGHLRALRLAGLRGCTLLAGPVTGAVFADDVRDCRLALATYQVRVHRTHATDLFLRCRSKPIIEHSAGVRVAPWAAAVAAEPRLDSLLQEHKLGEETGCWQQVEDFGWIKAVQSPNWCVLPEGERPQQPLAVPEEVWAAGAADGLADGAGGKVTHGEAAAATESLGTDEL